MSPASRNIISGNLFYGIYATRGAATIEGNYIGTDASGSKAVSNRGGISLGAPGVANFVIGGVTAGAGNVISGNGDLSGIAMRNGTGSRVQGNLIGTAANGIDPLPNSVGIEIVAASNNLIGDPAGKGGNVIAFSASHGIDIASGAMGNRVLSNRIFLNDQNPNSIPPSVPKQISLYNVSNRNDINDTDTGANNLQNFPIIIGHNLAPNAPAGTTAGTLEGALNSTPSRSYLLQFFYLGNDCQFLGTTTVQTDTGGNVFFTFPFSYPAQLAGGYFTATATDEDGNTSEFFPENGPVQLGNLSTRGFVGTGDQVLVGGFISIGDNWLVIRGLGPSVNVPNRLADPVIDVFDAGHNLVATNDSWEATNYPQTISQLGLAPTDPREAAVIQTFQPGNYTVQLRGADTGTGVGLIEIYSVADNLQPAYRHLANISTGGFVGTDDNVLIGGVTAVGNATQRVIVRAIGPDLSASGVPDALQDPVLELHDAAGTLIAANDNWRDQQEAEIRASKLAPNHDRDAAIIATIIPSLYTAVLRGKEGTMGVALIEVYDLTN